MDRRSTKWLFLMSILVALRDLFVQCSSHFQRIMDPFVHMLEIYLSIHIMEYSCRKLTILPIIKEIDGLFEREMDEP